MDRISGAVGVGMDTMGEKGGEVMKGVTGDDHKKSTKSKSTSHKKTSKSHK